MQSKGKSNVSVFFQLTRRHLETCGEDPAGYRYVVGYGYDRQEAEAFRDDMLAMLREHRALLRHGFLMHCYSHGAENMPAFAALGAYFSFGGVACFGNAKNVWESVAACPADRLLSETDSPYLSPFRGKKNTPANIPVIVRRLAQLRGEEEGALAAQICKNAQMLFRRSL